DGIRDDLVTGVQTCALPILDLIDPSLNFRALAVTLHQGGIFFVHHDALHAAEVFQAQRLELDAEVFTDELAAREDGDIFAHGFEIGRASWREWVQVPWCEYV